MAQTTIKSNQIDTALSGKTITTSSVNGVTLTTAGATTSFLTAAGSYAAVTPGNLTGAVTSTGLATSLGSFTSSQLATALTDETGTGANVFATSPTLVTPSLGVATATSVNGVALTTAGSATNFLNAAGTYTAASAGNLTGAVTSTGLATSLGSFTSAQLLGALTDETGTSKAVFSNNPTFDGQSIAHNFAGAVVRGNTNTTAPGTNGILLHQETYNGFDSASTSQLYHTDNIIATVATSGVEASTREFKNFVAGADTSIATFGAGLYLGTNTDQGVGSLNATSYFKAGTSVRNVLSYVSANQSITSGGLITLSHGLGAIPDGVRYFLQCITADGGYSVGDVIGWDICNTNTAGASFNTPTLTSSQILVRISSNSVLPYGAKTTGTFQGGVIANWQLIVKAWRFI